MQSKAARLGVLAAVVGAAVILFIVLSGGDDSGDGGGGTTPTTASDGATTVPDAPAVLTVRDGEPVGGVKTLTYDKGDQVNVRVNLDQPEEEIHVHGYEIEEPAETSPVRLSFTADIDGDRKTHV